MVFQESGDSVSQPVASRGLRGAGPACRVRPPSVPRSQVAWSAPERRPVLAPPVPSCLLQGPLPEPPSLPHPKQVPRLQIRIPSVVSQVLGYR